MNQDPHPGRFQTYRVQNWVLRVRRPPQDNPAPVVWMLHGLTGDEKVMEVFATRIPAHFRVLSLRAPYPSPLGGFSWLAIASDASTPLQAFEEPVRQLIFGFLPAAEERFGHPLQPAHLLGFSQGAALAYTLALTHPDLVASVAALAGFLPAGAESLAGQQSLAGIPVFVTHGTKDEQVPVEHARTTVRLLREAGAQITYCEADVGHKLGADCFRALAQFYQTLPEL